MTTINGVEICDYPTVVELSLEVYPVIWQVYLCYAAVRNAFFIIADDAVYLAFGNVCNNEYGL